MNLVPDTKAIIYLFAEGAGKLKTKFSDLHIYFIICCYFIRLFKSDRNIKMSAQTFVYYPL